MCWKLLNGFRTPRWDVSSCLLYCWLYLFFVFWSVFVITPFSFCVYFYCRMQDCIKNQWKRYLNFSFSHSLPPCPNFVPFMCNRSCTSIIVSVLIRKQALCVSLLNLLFSESKECRPSCLQYGHTVYYYCQTCRTVPTFHLGLFSAPPLHPPYNCIDSFPFLPPSLHLFKHQRTVRLCPLAVFLFVSRVVVRVFMWVLVPTVDRML